MNLPNKLTMLRILLVPVFMVLAGVTQYGTASYTTNAWYLAAGIVFAVASFTDYLDGYLVKTVLQMVTILYYYFAAALAGPTDVMAVGLISQVLCWLVAAVTLISGAKYLWDNRQFINTAK